MKNNIIFLVQASYDIAFSDRKKEIVEYYTTKELAEARCKQLISEWKSTHSESEANDWFEDSHVIWGFAVGKWDVAINVQVKIPFDELPNEKAV